jgi:predicted nucleic acid-binding protein
MIVLDTNVVSELMRPEPAAPVTAWFSQHSPGELVTTAMSLAEIRYGLARLPDGRRKQFLTAAADEVFSVFPDQVLPFDAAAAVQYADVVSRRDRVGAPISALDAQIAAVCRVHEATLATRNVADFVDTGIEVVDPWHGP